MNGQRALKALYIAARVLDVAFYVGRRLDRRLAPPPVIRINTPRWSGGDLDKLKAALKAASPRSRP